MKGCITYKKEKLWDKVHTIKNVKFYTGVNDLKEPNSTIVDNSNSALSYKNNCFEICLSN